MALNPIVETLEGVPEQLHEHYTPVEGGGFTLAVNGMITEQSVIGLKNTLNEVVKDRDNLKKVYNPFKEAGITDANQVIDVYAKYEELKKLDPTKHAEKLAEEKINQAILEKTQMWSQERQALEEKAKQNEALYHNTYLNSHISKEIANQQGIPEVLEPIISRYTKFDGEKIIVLDNNGNNALNNNGAPMSLAEFVVELKENEKYSGCFMGLNKSGSGKDAAPSVHRGANGKIRIKRGDQKALNQNWEALARGEVEIY